MLAVKSSNIRDDFKAWCDQIISGEEIVISRPQNKNVVMISESKYNELLKAARSSYLSMLDRSREQLQNGKTVVRTMEELENMADE